MKTDPGIIIHVPHSSTYIPEKHSGDYICDLKDEIYAMTDLYTDDLYDCGYEMCVFPVSRLFCDVERFRDDEAEPMSRIGMGIAYTQTSDGKILRAVSPELKAEILQMYYDMHHTKLTESVEDKLTLCGSCTIIDGHSFSPVPLKYESDKARPDICIGTDSFHTPAELTEYIYQSFIGFGYQISVNSPFAGTIVPMRFYGKEKKVSSIMIELNRGLYMDSQGNKTEGYQRLKSEISEIVSGITSVC